MDEKSNKNIFIYDISYTTLIGANPSCITLHKVDGFIRFYGGTRYLILSGSKKYGAIYDKIRHLNSQKSGVHCL